MMSSEEKRSATEDPEQMLHCPHCNEPLQPFAMPEGATWEEEFHCACFNDACPYYREGWEWMSERYGVTASYRFHVNPATGEASPIAVWSDDALKDLIL